MDHPARHTSCFRGPRRRSSWDSADSSYPWSAQTSEKGCPFFWAKLADTFGNKQLTKNRGTKQLSWTRILSDHENTPNSNGVPRIFLWKLMFWGCGAPDGGANISAPGWWRHLSPFPFFWWMDNKTWAKQWSSLSRSQKEMWRSSSCKRPKNKLGRDSNPSWLLIN